MKQVLKMSRFSQISLLFIGLLLSAFSAQAADWREGKPMPTARAYAGGAILGNNLYVIGGGGTSGPRSMMEIYDISLKSWTLGPGLPSGLQQFGITMLGGKLYVAGGYKAAELRAGTPEGETAELWVFDPSIGIWVSRTPMPGVRSSWAALAVRRQEFLSMTRPPMHGPSLNRPCQRRAWPLPMWEPTVGYMPLAVPRALVRPRVLMFMMLRVTNGVLLRNYLRRARVFPPRSLAIRSMLSVAKALIHRKPMLITSCSRSRPEAGRNQHPCAQRDMRVWQSHQAEISM